MQILGDTSQLGSHLTPRYFTLGSFSITPVVGHNVNAPKITEAQFNYTDELERFILGHYVLGTREITVQGYFISYKYLRGETPVQYEQNDYAVIHIRLKDYLIPEVVDFHGILPLTYYQEAIAKIPSHIPIKVISDDTAEAYTRIVKHLDRDRDIRIVNPSDPPLFMLEAKYLVIANSSYSLYSAYYNHKATMIIAPSKFFKASMPEQDLLKDNWTKIEVKY